MKISSLVKQVVKQIEARPLSQKLQRPASQQRDGFEAPRKTPISLGRVPAVSMGAEGEYVKGLYRDLLKREPDLDGFMSHLRGLENGMSREDIKNVFLSSAEYKALQTPAPAADAPSAPAETAKWQSVGPVPLEGYDAGKLGNLEHQTVKYQFGRVASHFPLDGVKDKAGAEALLKSMVPDLKAAGLDVQEVKGDKIRVATELGQEWVDVVRGAGSGNPGWWWGSEGKAIAGTEGTTPPRTQLPVDGSPAPTAPSAPTQPTPTGTIREPGEPLSTVPLRPEYAAAPIDTSSGPAAARSAAQWVKDTYPQLFGRGDDRQVAFEVMTHVIGAMRAHGFDAHRVVNHPSIPVGTGQRYGSDALVVGGQIYDVYGAFGEPGRSDVQLLNPGPYEAGRLRE